MYVPPLSLLPTLYILLLMPPTFPKNAKPTTPLTGIIAGSPGLITVMYADGSVFERFLLSGAGSAHYDAAVENPDGTFATFWLQHKLSLPGTGNAIGYGGGGE